ncbi:hypothetical protein CTheo_8712 [Ceratobasidium theobromae]|uniref:Helicase C-terminal domain-containing protein n=1 Tax=Ceratobasidium theobromae TaxID=1582974 RepID=A0A5N5Q7Y5_9AGAM|nr:hypothetical protein CTheo_8712 [Ceratobasidium theobromae]
MDMSMRGAIHLYHAHLDDFHKKVLTDGFPSKKFYALVSTESLTKGADFREVSLVINFMAASTLLTWLQRAGRGAWDPRVACHTLLMVQPSHFNDAATTVEEVPGVEEEILIKEEHDEPLMIQVPPELVYNEPGVDTEELDESNPTDDNQGKDRNGMRITYSKSIRGYIRTAGCRNAFLDREYDNPARLGTCTTCDDCISMTTHGIKPPLPESTPNTRQASKAPTAKLMNITEAYILSDKAITAFARHPNITSVLDLKTATTVWPHHEHWGQEIVDILWGEQREQEEEKNQSARLKEVRKAQRAQAKIEREQKKQAKHERMVAGL